MRMKSLIENLEESKMGSVSGRDSERIKRLATNLDDSDWTKLMSLSSKLLKKAGLPTGRLGLEEDLRLLSLGYKMASDIARDEA